MAYIETHQALLTHRKTLRLSRLLGIDRWGVAGRLMALWSWALDNAQEGVIAEEDGDILADVMGWDGEPSALCHALVSAGFLDQRTTCYVIHDWMDYAGRLIEKRKSDAERKRQSRASTGQPPTVQRTSAGHPADIRVTAQVPYPTVPYRNVPQQDLSSEESLFKATAVAERAHAQPTPDDDANDEDTPPAAAAAAVWTSTELQRVAERILPLCKLPTSARDGLMTILSQHPYAPAYLEYETVKCQDYYTEKRKRVSLRLIAKWYEDAALRRQQAQHDLQAHQQTAKTNDEGQHHGTITSPTRTTTPEDDAEYEELRRRTAAELRESLARQSA